MGDKIVPIPEPPGLPILGFTDIDTEFPLGSLMNLADKYGVLSPSLTVTATSGVLADFVNIGSIFRITTAGKSRVIVSSNALVNEVCDETRFAKIVAGALEV
jgi:cytochrome P450/NADPH-cytochrome P450 reductase